MVAIRVQILSDLFQFYFNDNVSMWWNRNCSSSLKSLVISVNDTSYKQNSISVWGQNRLYESQKHRRNICIFGDYTELPVSWHTSTKSQRKQNINVSYTPVCSSHLLWILKLWNTFFYFKMAPIVLFLFIYYIFPV